MSLVDDIYNGAYYPLEQVKPASEAFKEHADSAERFSNELESQLTEEQRETLAAYKREDAVVTDLYNLEFYRAGVQFGIRLMLEALSGSAEPPEIHK